MATGLISNSNTPAAMGGRNFMANGVILQSFKEFQSLGNDDWVVLFFKGTTDASGNLTVNLKEHAKQGATIRYVVLQEATISAYTGVSTDGDITIDTNAALGNSTSVTIAVFVKSNERATYRDVL